jgi:hypothetical protein
MMEGANPAPGASASAAGSEMSGRFRTADARRARPMLPVTFHSFT